MGLDTDAPGHVSRLPADSTPRRLDPKLSFGFSLSLSLLVFYFLRQTLPVHLQLTPMARRHSTPRRLIALALAATPLISAATHSSSEWETHARNVKRSNTVTASSALDGKTFDYGAASPRLRRDRS